MFDPCELPPEGPAAAEVIGLDPNEEAMELRPWLLRPLIIEREADGDTEVFRMRWPVGLVNEDLEAYLNLVAPQSDIIAEIRNDLGLQSAAQAQSRDLDRKHRASFPEWDTHADYARRAHEALRTQYIERTVNYGELEYRDSGAKLISRQLFEGEFDPLDYDYPLDALAKLTETHGIPSPDRKSFAKVKVEQLDPREPSNSIYVDDDTRRAMLSPGVISAFEEHNLDAKQLLLEIYLSNAPIVEFNGGDDEDPWPMLAIGTAQLDPIIVWLAFKNQMPRKFQGTHSSFDYVPVGDRDFIPIIDTLTIDDQRSHLQPELVWRKTVDGERIVEFTAPILEESVVSGARSFTRVRDPILGTTIPFLLTPSYRKTPEKWRPRDFLPSTLEQAGIESSDEAFALEEMGQLPDGIRPNMIGPANIVMYSIWKLADITGQFPFEQFEERATTVSTDE